jgi:putative nucleotidyltransferase with HDIG domain
MRKVDIVEDIRRRDDLLSLPQALSEILKEMVKPNFSADTLANIILKDPSLTGRILKLANSSFYQRLSQVKTVHAAVQLLGVTTVKCLALSSSVFNAEQIERESGLDTKAYFAQILTVAAAAEKIAKKIEYKAPEEAMIAGLLHDIGTMVFLHHYPDEYRRVMAGKIGARNLSEAEIEVFGIDHAELGYHLAIKWRLPEQIIDAIRDHHSPADTNDNPIKNILRLASLLATDTSSNFSEDIEDRLGKINQVARCLSLSREEVDAISVSLLSSTVSVADYLGIDIGDHQEMLSRANQEIWKAYLTVENLFKERQELSRKLLQEERAKGAVESKNIAMATLSHYLNNAAMAISGRSQILRMRVKKGMSDEIMSGLPVSLDVIDRSISKIVAVLAEISEISPIDEVEFLSTSKAMNIDDRIEKRMKIIAEQPVLVLQEEAEIFP